MGENIFTTIYDYIIYGVGIADIWTILQSVYILYLTLIGLKFMVKA